MKAKRGEGAPLGGPRIVPAQSDSAIEAAVRELRAGRPVAVPTETVYGLAGWADDTAGVAAVFDAKGRPRGHPLIVHVGDAAAADHYAAQVPERARRLMQAFWPGPLTLILPRRPGVAEMAAGGQPTIGLRCPAHPVAQRLLRACARAGIHGLAIPSANRFGRVSPTSAAHVAQEFAGLDLLVLDGGACAVGIESAIVDLSRGQAVLLRPGTLTRQALEQVLGEPLAHASEGDPAAPRAPGTLASHYAPRAAVRLMSAEQLRAALEVLDDAVVPVGVYARVALPQRVRGSVWRRMPDDAAAAARELFAVLRELDESGVSLIWVEAPPADEAWAGVRDRLRRASAPRETAGPAPATIADSNGNSSQEQA